MIFIQFVRCISNSTIRTHKNCRLKSTIKPTKYTHSFETTRIGITKKITNGFNLFFLRKLDLKWTSYIHVMWFYKTQSKKCTCCYAMAQNLSLTWTFENMIRCYSSSYINMLPIILLMLFYKWKSLQTMAIGQSSKRYGK